MRDIQPKLARRAAIASAVALLAVATAAVATPVYRATDAGLLPGSKETWLYDLNNRGQGVGYSVDAITWTAAGGLKAYRQPNDPERYLLFTALNDVGMKAGIAGDGTRREPVVRMPDGTLRFPVRGTWAAANPEYMPVRDVSNAGHVLGTSGYPWLWSPEGGLRDLGDSRSQFDAYEVMRVNVRGQVAGYRAFDHFSNDCYGTRAFVYDDATRRFLAIDGGPEDLHADLCGRWSQATAINDLGQVVGYRDEIDPQGYRFNHGFVWTADAGHRRIESQDPTLRDIVPADINNHGQVVGTYDAHGPWQEPRRYFYWDAQTGMKDISDLLDPSDPMSANVKLRTTNLTALQINDAGVISLHGWRSDAPYPRWFLLYPQ